MCKTWLSLCSCTTEYNSVTEYKRDEDKKLDRKVQIGLNPAAWCPCDSVACLMLQQVCGFNEVLSLSNKLMNKKHFKNYYRTQIKLHIGYITGMLMA